MRAVFANLGFIFQIAGLLVYLPILVAFKYNETTALISFFVTATVFMGIGFLLNAFSQRKELDFKASCALITLAFVFLGAVGSIPYLWLNPVHLASTAEQVTDYYFESVSSFTTTGFSLISDVDSLPRSIIFYRGLSQFIGGIGVVFILLAFFYPEKDVVQLSKAIGMGAIENLKRSFMAVLLVYTIYAAVFTAALYFLGFKEVVSAISIILGALMTGGLSVINDFSVLANWKMLSLITIAMLFGAFSFWSHHAIFTGRARRAITSELLVFLLVVLSGSLMVKIFVGASFGDSIFHAASASSTTGYSYIDLAGIPDSAKLVFAVLMFIGGSSFSTSGGVKVMRLIIFLKSIPWAVRRLITEDGGKLVFEGRPLEDREVVQSLLLILLGISTVFVSAFVLVSSGFGFVDSVFESTSAFATTGFSAGIITPALPMGLKWLFIALMIVGRVEVIPLLVLISPYKKAQS